MNGQKSDSAMTEANKESIATNNEIGGLDDSVLIVATIFCFLPSFGTLGVHNFILKQYKKAIGHIALYILCTVPSYIVRVSCGYEGSGCRDMIRFTTALQCLSISSYIWAVVEGINILRFRRQRASATLIKEKQKADQSPSSVVNTGGTGDQRVTKQEEKQNGGMWSIVSIVATIIPIIFWLYCLITSGGSTSEGDSGAVWWLMVVYYGSLGFPLLLVSILFAVKGFDTRLRWLSFVSLSLKAATILGILLSFVFSVYLH